MGSPHDKLRRPKNLQGKKEQRGLALYLSAIAVATAKSFFLWTTPCSILRFGKRAEARFAACSKPAGEATAASVRRVAEEEQVSEVHGQDVAMARSTYPFVHFSSFTSPRVFRHLCNQLSHKH